VNSSINSASTFTKEKSIMAYELSKSFFISTRLALIAAVLLGAVVMVGTTSARAADGLEQQQLVEKAKMTLEAFAADPNVSGAVRDLKGEAKALFIVPQFVRGAFVFGGAGGSGAESDPTRSVSTRL
jgi:lipid-binding SYLF domain-containing protein